MTTVSLELAEKELSVLMERARSGEDIVISDGKEPGVRLTLARSSAVSGRSRRGFGSLEGKINIPDEALFDPLPEDELAQWYGEKRGK